MSPALRPSIQRRRMRRVVTWLMVASCAAALAACGAPQLPVGGPATGYEPVTTYLSANPTSVPDGWARGVAVEVTSQDYACLNIVCTRQLWQVVTTANTVVSLEVHADGLLDGTAGVGVGDDFRWRLISAALSQGDVVRLRHRAVAVP